MRLIKEKYDVIIIGAGIGGLICGCYLAKSGIKVLIVEKNNKPGGYCTSFDKQGYKFDLGVHSIGSLGKGEFLDRIFGEIGLWDFLEIIRTDPTNTIITPDFEVNFYSDRRLTIDEFKKIFPKDKSNIENFFNLLFKMNMHQLYSDFSKHDFGCVLDKYFNNDKVKSTVEALLGNSGVPSKYLSAFTGLLMIREFVFNGGYHTKKGGIQSLSDALEKVLVKNGGLIKYNTKVERILIKNNTAKGIFFNDRFIESRYTISASDVRSTFLNLIDAGNNYNTIIKRIHKLVPTSSAFLVFLGLKQNALKRISKSCSTWLCNNYFYKDYFPDPFLNKECLNKKPILIFTPTLYDSSLAKNGGEIVIGLINFNFRKQDFWNKNALKIRDSILNAIIKTNLFNKSDIMTEEIMTPEDLFLLTNNYKGAIRGWASTPYQNSLFAFSKKSIVKNLFFVGHWTTYSFGQGGLSNVANTARRVSEKILMYENMLEETRSI